MGPDTAFGWDSANAVGSGAVVEHQCVMHSIVFNGMTTVGDVGIFDGVDNTGELKGTLILRSAVQVSCQPFTLILDIAMKTGIHLELTDFVGNFTVTYK